MLKHSEIHHQKKERSSIRTALLLYFSLDKKYPMIISTPCSRYRENAQFLNRSTGTYTPEYMVLLLCCVGLNIRLGRYGLGIMDVCF